MHHLIKFGLVLCMIFLLACSEGFSNPIEYSNKYLQKLMFDHPLTRISSILLKRSNRNVTWGDVNQKVLELEQQRINTIEELKNKTSVSASLKHHS